MRTLTFDQALRRAMDDRGCTLRSLHQQLAARGISIGLSTLSYWRSGDRLPERQRSLTAISAIEEVLDLAPGTLLEARGPSRRGGPSKAVGYRTLVDRALDDGIDRVRAGRSTALPDSPTELEQRSSQQIATVDDRGQTCHVAVRDIWRARRDGARIFPIFYAAEKAIDGPPIVRPVTNFDLGEVVFDAEHGVLAAQAVIPRPLRLHESILTEYEVPEPWTGSPDLVWSLLAPTRMVECVVSVRFDNALRPVRCTEFVTDEAGVERSWEVPLHDGELFAARWGFGPGSFGFRWEYA
ncbi:hypothetical protein HJ588_13160 [Flexivirga sp. ID2601S]|uniref:Uncharacterized protein n=1 Tax=Flexivirga aerilata TaxID=1656889 RepID=A0A849AIE1_9MICO|nr:helix-turn-helix transcriptional regulator [Flexivirga aerilata]NNG40215.1 hypothetical protein [Flexivirga aerilata]